MAEKFEKIVIGNFDAIIKQLDDDIMASAFSMKLVNSSDYQKGDLHVVVNIYDKYFMRNSSRASLTVTAVDYMGEIFISAIGSGGGTGAIIDFNWGAEDELIGIVEDSLKNMGF
jgi:hypothetical protein